MFKFLILLLAFSPVAALAGAQVCSSADGNIRLSTTYADDANTKPVKSADLFNGAALPSDAWVQFGAEAPVKVSSTTEGGQTTSVVVRFVRILKNGQELGIYDEDYVLCTETSGNP